MGAACLGGPGPSQAGSRYGGGVIRDVCSCGAEGRMSLAKPFLGCARCLAAPQRANCRDWQESSASVQGTPGHTIIQRHPGPCYWLWAPWGSVGEGGGSREWGMHGASGGGCPSALPLPHKNRDCGTHSSQWGGVGGGNDSRHTGTVPCQLWQLAHCVRCSACHRTLVPPWTLGSPAGQGLPSAY